MQKGYGGNDIRGSRKVGRPFEKSVPIHVVLITRASKSLNERKYRFLVDSRVYILAKRYEVKIYEYSNQGNQLHILLSANNRHQLTCYLRLVTGQVAQIMTGAKKGVKKGKYWSSLCWSHLLSSRTQLKQVRALMRLNKITELATELGYDPKSWKLKKPVQKILNFETKKSISAQTLPRPKTLNPRVSKHGTAPKRSKAYVKSQPNIQE